MFSRPYLRKHFLYDPLTGFWYWRRAGKNRTVGARADRASKRGYARISIGHKRYFAHRLAWIYMRGFCPAGIDHADGNGLNNIWKNLRAANQTQNSANARLRRDNTSGFKGITWDRKRRRWYAFITVGKEMVSLGRHRRLEDAILIRQQAAISTFGAFARHA